MKVCLRSPIFRSERDVSHTCVRRGWLEQRSNPSGFTSPSRSGFPDGKERLPAPSRRLADLHASFPPESNKTMCQKLDKLFHFGNHSIVPKKPTCLRAGRSQSETGPVKHEEIPAGEEELGCVPAPPPETEAWWTQTIWAG